MSAEAILAKNVILARMTECLKKETLAKEIAFAKMTKVIVGVVWRIKSFRQTQYKSSLTVFDELYVFAKMKI